MGRRRHLLPEGPLHRASEPFNGDNRIRQTVIRFDVEQRFLNVPSGPVEIVTDGLSTCSYPFRRGEKYVV
jgi:hypothetical protein